MVMVKTKSQWNNLDFFPEALELAIWRSLQKYTLGYSISLWTPHKGIQDTFHFYLLNFIKTMAKMQLLCFEFKGVFQEASTSSNVPKGPHELTVIDKKKICLKV